jgi:hypothetical protein
MAVHVQSMPLPGGFAARAWIGGKHQLEPGGVGRCSRRAVDHQLSAFQRLPEGIQDPAFILRSLIQEQDPAMCAREAAPGLGSPEPPPMMAAEVAL